MARSCSICQHPRLYDINKALTFREVVGRKAGFTYRSIAKEYNVSKDALKNHWRGKGHNRRPDAPEGVPSALIPQSEKPQSIIVAGGDELRIVSFQTLVETALAVGYNNILNDPGIMTPTATAKFIGLAVKWGWDIGETDAYGKVILEYILGRAADDRSQRDRSQRDIFETVREMPEEADAPEDTLAEEPVNTELQEDGAPS